MIEELAKKIAIANNGGNWAKHYTEDQKNVWRIRAQEILDYVKGKLVEN